MAKRPKCLRAARSKTAASNVPQLSKSTGRVDFSQGVPDPASNGANAGLAVGTTAVRLFSKFGGAIFKADMPQQLTCVETHGNTSTTSHFMVLHKHLKENRVKKGAKFLLVPAASGVITGCVAVTLSSLEV